MSIFSRDWIKDVGERAISTYIEAVCTFLILNWSDTISLDLLETAAASGVPALLAVVKGALARTTGDPESASFNLPRVREL